MKHTNDDLRIKEFVSSNFSNFALTCALHQQALM